MTATVEDLGIHWVNGEPMVYELDLARALGYSRPRSIRQTIGRLLDQGKIGPSQRRHTAWRYDGDAYYLGEKAALKVVTKSETPKADAITDQVIEVRKGQLSGDKGF